MYQSEIIERVIESVIMPKYPELKDAKVFIGPSITKNSDFKIVLTLEKGINYQRKVDLVRQIESSLKMVGLNQIGKGDEISYSFVYVSEDI